MTSASDSWGRKKRKYNQEGKVLNLLHFTLNNNRSKRHCLICRGLNQSEISNTFCFINLSWRQKSVKPNNIPFKHFSKWMTRITVFFFIRAFTWKDFPHSAWKDLQMSSKLYREFRNVFAWNKWNYRMKFFTNFLCRNFNSDRGVGWNELIKLSYENTLISIIN